MALDSGVVYVSYASGGAAAAAEAFTLCNISANRRMIATGNNAKPDGVFYEAPRAAGDVVPIADWRHSQTVRVAAAGAIADGHFVRANNAAKVVSDGAAATANSIGRCIGGAANGEVAQILTLER